MQWIQHRKGHWITSSNENCRLLLQYLERHNSYYPQSIATQKFPYDMKLTFLRLYAVSTIHYTFDFHGHSTNHFDDFFVFDDEQIEQDVD